MCVCIIYYNIKYNVVNGDFIIVECTRMVEGHTSNKACRGYDMRYIIYI